MAILNKDLARLWKTRLEVYDEMKYSGDETGEDTDYNTHMKEERTGGNNQGLGETSDR